MEYRRLGRSGLMVPALSLGTGTFGGFIQDTLGAGTQTVALSVTGGTLTLTGTNNSANTLTLNLNAPATVALGAAGPTTGASFGVGGSISVKDTTPDDLYTGSLTVNADYQ